MLAMFLMRRLTRKWKRLSMLLYPDVEDRIYALLVEAAELYEIQATASGEVLENIVIVPHEEIGYNIMINHVSDYIEEG